MRIVYCAFAAGVSLNTAFGCDLCSTYAASQARGEYGQGFFSGVAEQFTHFGTVQVDGNEVANPADQYLDSSISQVFAGYNLTKRWGVQFNMPVIYRNFRRPDGYGGIQTGTESGLGDASLLGTFVAYRKLSEDYTITWDLLGGVKFPTGNSDRLKEEFTELPNPVGPPSGIHGHDLALGSGSYDGLLGSSFYGRLHREFFTANLQYAIRSEGDFTYRYANDLTWSVAPGYYFIMDDDCTLGLQGLATGEYKGTDTFQGASAEDTGLTALYLGPQLSFTWSDWLSAQLAMELPIVMDNTALQTVADYRIIAALTLRF